MNILFIMLAFPKLEEPSMYTSLVREFKRNGHSVYPVAPLIPEYNHTGLYEENGVKVLRVKTLDLFDNNLFKKGVANLSLSFLYKKAIKKYWRDLRIDVIVVPTPSVLFADVVTEMAGHYKAKVYLMLKDIFPQNAVDLGMMKKNGLIYRYFRSKEKKLYKSAEWIGCTSQGNIDYLLAHNQVTTKVHILNNCSEPIALNIDDDLKNKVRKEYGLRDNFVVVFGGNMGKPQQLENVILLAKSCEVFPDVIFLIIGKGTQLSRLKDLVENEQLHNVKLIDKLPLLKYRELVSSCDIGLISLHKNFTVPNTPYKLNDYFALHLPVLASIDHGTDLGKILVENEAGLYAYADKPDNLFEQFKRLYLNADLRKKMGYNGNKFFNANMTIRIAYKTMLSHMMYS